MHMWLQDSRSVDDYEVWMTFRQVLKLLIPQVLRILFRAPTERNNHPSLFSTPVSVAKNKTDCNAQRPVLC